MLAYDMLMLALTKAKIVFFNVISVRFVLYDLFVVNFTESVLSVNDSHAVVLLMYF